METFEYNEKLLQSYLKHDHHCKKVYRCYYLSKEDVKCEFMGSHSAMIEHFATHTGCYNCACKRCGKKFVELLGFSNHLKECGMHFDLMLLPCSMFASYLHSRLYSCCVSMDTQPNAIQFREAQEDDYWEWKGVHFVTVERNLPDHSWTQFTTESKVAPGKMISPIHSTFYRTMGMEHLAAHQRMQMEQSSGVKSRKRKASPSSSELSGHELPSLHKRQARRKSSDEDLPAFPPFPMFMAQPIHPSQSTSFVNPFGVTCFPLSPLQTPYYTPSE
ncbi:unnamed protein product [Caenorhabditis nigoni]